MMLREWCWEKKKNVAELNPRARGLTVSSGPISSLKAFALLAATSSLLSFIATCLWDSSFSLVFRDYRFRDRFSVLLLVSFFSWHCATLRRRDATRWFWRNSRTHLRRAIFVKLEQARSAWLRNRCARF